MLLYDGDKRAKRLLGSWRRCEVCNFLLSFIAQRSNFMFCLQGKQLQQWPTLLTTHIMFDFKILLTLIAIRDRPTNKPNTKEKETVHCPKKETRLRSQVVDLLRTVPAPKVDKTKALYSKTPQRDLIMSPWHHEGSQSGTVLNRTCRNWSWTPIMMPVNSNNAINPAIVNNSLFTRNKWYKASSNMEAYSGRSAWSSCAPRSCGSDWHVNRIRFT